jgi:hypothetical protein
MKVHRYRVTVEHIATPNEEPPQPAPLVFEVSNHDDLFGIVARMRARTDITPEETAPLAIGLKLLGEIALAHRNEALFADITKAVGAFIGRLKKTHN